MKTRVSSDGRRDLVEVTLCEVQLPCSGEVWLGGCGGERNGNGGVGDGGLCGASVPDRDEGGGEAENLFHRYFPWSLGVRDVFQVFAAGVWGGGSDLVKALSSPSRKAKKTSTA